MDEFTTVKNPKGKSDIWRHFGLQKSKITQKLIDNTAVCMKCDMVIKCSGGGTSNLSAHIRRHHPSLLSSAKSLNSSSKTTTADVHVDQKQSETVSLPTIPKLFASKYASSSDRSKLITNKIARFLVKDLRPYSMVESPEFKDLISCLDPRYTVPGRKVFSERIIPEMYESAKENVKLNLKNAEQVSLTTDGWTSCATESYMTVTSSHITDSWELKNFVLQTRALPESHTAVHVTAVLNAAVEERALPTGHGKPTLVTDNASNMVKAGELFGSLHLGCYAHTLNIAVQKCLSVKRASHLLAKIRRIVAFFHRSNIANNILQVKAEALGLPQHKLIIDVSTRWNSAYDMVSRFLEMQVAVFATLRSKDVGKVSDVSISDEELLLAEEMIKFQKPLKDITVMLCSENNPTVSVIMPLQHQIVNSILTGTDTECPAVTEMKSLVKKSLEPRYKGSEQVLNMCSALDPRFKMLPFLSDEDKAGVFNRLTSETVTVNEVSKVKVEPDENLLTEIDEPELPSLP
ncbi:E3 SUMO-protein ligase ZBED1-like [Ruditapes philippinarum]|uniref:E3 SUMO-protein ligase ZBED1-like n=1 Tax=Ruditapes philippinarum TaxID=129788 RepID=UPI00295A8937|nr:E3 SUMO-protein ligase ZBED1-like [Ruditapes philippinarum]